MHSRARITLLLVAATAVFGVICIERTHVAVRDAWRDMTMMRDELPLNSPGAASPNPPDFVPPLAGTQMSSTQVRRIFDAIHQAGGGEGINLLVFGLGHDSAYWNKVNSGGYTVFVEDR